MCFSVGWQEKIEIVKIKMKLDLYRFFSVKNVTVTFLEMNRSDINSSFDFKPVVWSLIHPVVSYLEVAMDPVEHMKPCTYYSC